MKAADPIMVVKSSHNETQWENWVELLISKNYKNHFNVTKSKPPHGARKVIVHFKLQIKLRINDMKFSSKIFTYLKTNNIYLVNDR